MTLHDLITLMILLIGTPRTNEIQYMKYTSEYIPGSSSSLLPLSQSNGAISQFYSSQEVLQSQPFFMMVVGLASM